MCVAIWTTLSILPATAIAADCRDVTFAEASFTVCEANPETDDIRLFWQDGEGRTLGTFENLNEHAAPLNVIWAMNGGMYHSDRRPVGHYVENGELSAPLVTREGPGNFGLLPNGVLCISGAARVIETLNFAAERPDCQFATQSGPMLVIDGALHPRFIPNSDSLKYRNGVGIRVDGTLVAAISNEPVNFHLFARLFRDVLQTPNALFLDGSVSRLYAPALGRNDAGFPMGPILGVLSSDD